MAEPIKVFISYSHRDEALRLELVSHLSGLQKHRGLIELWHDRNIDAGTDWDQQIDRHLKQAEIIVFLVSAGFINSRYCRSVEMKHALERHRLKTARVIPVIIRDCDWKSTDLSVLQGIPRDNRAVATWGDEYGRDSAWVQVAAEIGTVAQAIQAQREAEQQTQDQAAARVAFRDFATELCQEGEFSPAQVTRLRVRAQKLKLEPTEAEGIKAAVVAAYQAHQQNLELYRQAVVAEVQHRQGLDADARAALQGLREDLGISDVEAQAIEAAVEHAAEQSVEQSVGSGVTLQTFSFKTVLLGQKQQVENTEERQAQYFKETLVSGGELEMVAIPEGSFLMGSPDGEGHDNEHPQHRVEVPSFFLGKYPVTQAQWLAVAQLAPVKIDLEPYPSSFEGERHPVEQVSWYEAVEFCDRISRETGKSYRLPSEAEWEYACRSQTTTKYHFGPTISPEFVNCGGHVGQTSPVDKYPAANSFGLFDLHGNVWEWCLDHGHSNYRGAPQDGSPWLSDNDNRSRVVRGGSWILVPRLCRSAYRSSHSPDARDDYIGFRVALSAPRILS